MGGPPDCFPVTIKVINPHEVPIELTPRDSEKVNIAIHCINVAVQQSGGPPKDRGLVITQDGDGFPLGVVFEILPSI